MKKSLATVVAAVGLVVTLWAASSVIATGKRIYGYDAVYVGVAGVGMLSLGLILRQD